MMCGVVALGLVLGGCTSSPAPQATTSRHAEAAPSGQSTAAGPRTPGPSTSPPPEAWASGRSSFDGSPTEGPSTSVSTNADKRLAINIRIADEKTTPSRKKINARVGQKVILKVTTDTDDEIHVNLAWGYQLPVHVGRTTRASFILDQPGSF